MKGSPGNAGPSPGGFALAEGAGDLAACECERLSRVHAFTSGWIMGRDVVGLVDEERLYQFAKEFTEKTMFGYTTADRPGIFTTPLGSATDLFKTWMMNHMMAMLEHTGQSATRECGAVSLAVDGRHGCLWSGVSSNAALSERLTASPRPSPIRVCLQKPPMII